MKKVRLVCKGIYFYSSLDEDAFFEWIKKISYVLSVKGFGEEIYIDIDKSKLVEENLREILALFYRYNIDMKQLEIFLSDENKSWFFDNKESFWYGGIWGKKRMS
jgi:hypothetical protein